MEGIMQNISVNIPKADMKLFRDLVKRMGWKISTNSELIDKYLSSRPTSVNLSEEEIQEELNAVRYNR